jgi:hypothetical protein
MFRAVADQRLLQVAGVSACCLGVIWRRALHAGRAARVITAQRTINAYKPKVSPIAIAAAWYKKWDGNAKFIDDLDDYHLKGVVISTPWMFAMAKVIDLGGEPAWFVRMAVGRLETLVSNLPIYLPKICFCRRNDGRLRVYHTSKLISKGSLRRISDKKEGR